MPYPTLDSLPDAIKKMPQGAQHIWQSAYNAAFKQYDGNEQKSAATAWAAVKTKYKKSGDKWVAKESNMEDLQSVYSEIIQEAGKRNASADAARIKKIMELCQELLDKEPTEEKEDWQMPVDVAGCIEEANSVLKWLKLQEVMKTDDGEKFPSQAYAYVPDAEKPSEWKLRLWETPTLKVTRKQLGAASAALSPGGFRGQKVQIPGDDLPAVKRRIRAEYRKLDVEDEDIPKWVKEADMRFLFDSYTSLKEASLNGKGIARVVIIKPGWGNPVDNHYYPAEMLARDFKAFEGAKMYADHQTESEEKERPEGSIKEWVASLKNVRFEENVGVVGDAIIIEPWMQAKLANLKDKDLLGEMGISIRAAGVGTKGKVEDRECNIVEKITQVRSVDFVTEAGAGGAVQMYEVGSHDLDVDIVSLETLKERRPDLIKAISDEVKAITIKEVKKMSELETKTTDLEGQIGTLTTERDELKGQLEEAAKAQRIAEAKSKIDEAISASELPEVAKAKLSEKFTGAETADGVEEAIKAEKEYIAALSEAGKVKGMGEKQEDQKASKDALKESFKRLGMTDDQAEIAVAGR